MIKEDLNMILRMKKDMYIEYGKKKPHTPYTSLRTFPTTFRSLDSSAWILDMSGVLQQKIGS
jgi:hypothetical protein